jgi:uncharacterized protein
MSYEQAIRSAFERLSAGDPGGIMELADPDIVLHFPESLPYGGPYRGHEGLGELLAQFGEWYGDDLRIQVDDVAHAGGDRLLVMLHATATARKTGEPFESWHAELWRMRDARCVELRNFYWDTAAVLRTIGAPAPA